VSAGDLREQVREFLAAHDPAASDRLEFLRARFDAGLAWVHYPAGLGGQGLSRSLQPVADAEFAAAGAPTNRPERNGIGLGMAAPTILAYGSEEQKGAGSGRCGPERRSGASCSVSPAPALTWPAWRPGPSPTVPSGW